MNIISIVGSNLAWFMQPTRDQIEAYEYSTTKAQMNGRKADPDPASKDYFDAMIATYRTVGWTLTDRGDFSSEGDGDQITPIHVLLNGVRTSVRSHGGSPELQLALSAMEPALYLLLAAPASVQKGLDHWWANCYRSQEHYGFDIGPFINIAGTPNLIMAYSSFKFPGTGWRDLFHRYRADTVAASCACWQLELDMRAYSIIEPSLKRELQATVDRSVIELTI